MSLHFQFLPDHPVYKYRLGDTYVWDLDPDFPQVWVHLAGGWASIAGRKLIIKAGYCWDGTSGPSLDTMSVAEASLVHDTLYQIIAEGRLPIKPWKKYADQELYRIAKMRGVPWWRATYTYWAVRMFGRCRDRYSHPGD